MEKKYIKSVGIVHTGIKSGICGNWTLLDELTADDHTIFEYMKGICQF